MREDGLLLVTAGADGKPNVMTIGWAPSLDLGSAGLHRACPALTPHLQPHGRGRRVHRQRATPGTGG